MEFRNAETLLLKLNISRFYNGWRYHIFLFLFFIYLSSRYNRYKVSLIVLLYLYFINYDTLNSILYMTNNEYTFFEQQSEILKY